MTLTLCVPVFDQLHDAKGPLGLLRHNTSDDVEWLVIDNGSTDPVEDFVRQYLRPKRLNYIRNPKNIGLVKTMQQAYENCTTDILALTHDDVFIYEKNWDQRVVSCFEQMGDLGGVGFMGSQGCGPRGERIQDVPQYGMAAGRSNMLEAEIHGIRQRDEWHPAAIFDGLMMVFRMEMLHKGNGFDQRYHYHHVYDRDAALESLRRGYRNIIVNVPCHHWCGMTANRSGYQDWVNDAIGNRRGNLTGDQWTMEENLRIFTDKWGDVLPIYVGDDFGFRDGKRLGGDGRSYWDFKGDRIVGFSNG